MVLYLCRTASSMVSSSSELMLRWLPSECIFSYSSAISVRAWIKWHSCSDRCDSRSSRQKAELGWLWRPIVTTFRSSLYSEV